jgi:catecholate siderophore receptor
MLQVNVYNLTDRYYYDQIHNWHIVPGAGRSALFSASFKY